MVAEPSPPAGFTGARVQELRRLLGRRAERHERRRFVVEGPVAVAEAVHAGWPVLAQFVDRPDASIEGAGEVVHVADDVLGRLGSTETPQQPVAIVAMPDRHVPDVLSTASLVVVLDRVADPGNAGTIIRSAEAAGADAVVLTTGSVDAYSPKVVRASAGALFHVPIVTATLEQVGAAGLALVGTSSHDRLDRTLVAHTRADLTGRVALVVGNEASGLPDEWNDETGPIRRWVTIPHRGRGESLNVAMAATVLLFEAARQRAGS